MHAGSLAWPTGTPKLNRVTINILVVTDVFSLPGQVKISAMTMVCYVYVKPVNFSSRVHCNFLDGDVIRPADQGRRTEKKLMIPHVV